MNFTQRFLKSKLPEKSVTCRVLLTISFQGSLSISKPQSNVQLRDGFGCYIYIRDQPTYPISASAYHFWSLIRSTTAILAFILIF